MYMVSDSLLAQCCHR